MSILPYVNEEIAQSSNDTLFPLTIAPPTAKLEQMTKVGGTRALAQTPQFDSFNTQPLDALAQQPSQGQIAVETDFDDISGSFTPITISRNLSKKKLTRIVAIIIILALCIAL